MRGVALTLIKLAHDAGRQPAGVDVFDGSAAGGIRPVQQDEQARRLIDEAIGIVEDNAQDYRELDVKGEVLSPREVFSAAVGALIDLTEDAQMIVVGSRGQGGPVRGLLGSVSTGLVHHAHCPVAVIHDEAAEVRSSSAPVLVGVDGSPASELAAAIAFDEASWRGVDLVALYACSDAVVYEIPAHELVCD